jgi:flavin-dependent dehydrogenase
VSPVFSPRIPTVCARRFRRASSSTPRVRRRWLRHAAFFTRYRGALRDEGIDEGATLILRTLEDRSWFWFIPLPDDVVSVGVVGPVGHLLKGRAADPAVVYGEELERCPALLGRLEKAEQLWDVRVMRDFSYVSSRIGGDGWVLAGDAFGFLDPIYSTGVFLALKSGELAADAVLAAFEHDDFTAARLGSHGERYLAAMEALRGLVHVFYDETFSVAGFLRDNPQFRGDVVNLLVGNVFRTSVGGLFEAMGRECELPAPLFPEQR